MAKMGRPSDNPRTTQIGIRVTPDEKAKIIECTKKYGVTMADLIMQGVKTIEKK